MKQQVLIINGGDAFDTYELYLNDLKSKTPKLERLRPGGWKGNFQTALGEDYDVFVAQMPNSQNAQYTEWKIWFEKIMSLVDEGIILVGHSLGGIFLAKYLSENNSQKKIKALILLAAPYCTREENHLAGFDLENLEYVSSQVEKIFIYHSKDDPVVPFEDAEKYAKALRNAEMKVFEDKMHFNQSEFPELAQNILNLH